MRISRLAILLLSGICPAPQVWAHGGGLDANGGHMNHRTGEYHIHRPGGYSGGGGTSGAGAVGVGSSYYAPKARVRARTSARTTPRTEANTTSRNARSVTSYSFTSGREDTPRTSKPSSPEGSPQVGRVEDPEARARELLRLAKLLILQDKIPGAIGYLKELTTKYPETEAGKEAAVLLPKYQGSGKR